MSHSFSKVKNAVLAHVQSLFEEMEESMAMSHQEKYALLEDVCENATDKDELRVALEQWYAEHGEDSQMEKDVDEIWDEALGILEEAGEEGLEGDDADMLEEDEEEEAEINYNDEYEK